MSDILSKITEECKKQNLSLAALEKKANLSNGSICKWNKSQPRIDTLQKVATALNIPVEYLISRG